jgi:hypothetical protein
MEDELEQVQRFLAPDETAAQLLARTFVAPLRTGLPLIDRFLAFRGGQVLEVAGGAGVGRTTALLQVAATCILPETLGGVAYGGRGGGSPLVLRWRRRRVQAHRLAGWLAGWLRRGPHQLVTCLLMLLPLLLPLLQAMCCSSTWMARWMQSACCRCACCCCIHHLPAAATTGTAAKECNTMHAMPYLPC